MLYGVRGILKKAVRGVKSGTACWLEEMPDPAYGAPLKTVALAAAGGAAVQQSFQLNDFVRFEYGLIYSRKAGPFRLALSRQDALDLADSLNAALSRESDVLLIGQALP